MCSYRQGKLLQPVSEYKKRLGSIREQMQIRASLQGPEIDGYILPSYDENLNSEVADYDKRLQYISGFSGHEAFATITAGRAALWVDEKFLRQADGELDCEWEIYDINGPVRISDWFEVSCYNYSSIKCLYSCAFVVHPVSRKTNWSRPSPPTA